MRQNRILGALAITFALVASGCGKSKLVAVQGVVTLDGEPVEGVSVTFVPDQTGGYPAGGWTDSDGVFRLTTYSEGDGALPGDYRVTVTRKEIDLAQNSKRMRNSRAKMDKAEMKKVLAGKASEPRNLLPAIYGDRARSPLRWRVPDDGKRTLELTSKGPAAP